ncbi:hypothetical protein [Jeotgalibacillus terrae]|uniref:DUF3923 domain-containing protein n=1 Tax=Jeotgalibacillus terrae TaxID=587735 RepID=A0ABW5ZIZ2_9BACL|nr:hypothetical protein [Jeotgalibacillus terrae]MBM7578707.1 hypothetical protein [Jeotgalibacillus terrae]
MKKKVLLSMVWLTGIYCLLHIIFDFNIKQNMMIFGIDTHITISLFTRVIQLLFFILLFIYFQSYIKKADTKAEGS